MNVVRTVRNNSVAKAAPCSAGEQSFQAAEHEYKKELVRRSSTGSEETELAMQVFFKDLTTLLEQLRVLTMKSCQFQGLEERISNLEFKVAPPKPDGGRQFQGLEERIANLEFKVTPPKPDAGTHEEVPSEIPEVPSVMQVGLLDSDTEIQVTEPASYEEQPEDVTGANEQSRNGNARKKPGQVKQRPRKLGPSAEAQDQDGQSVKEEHLETNAAQPSILRATLQLLTNSAQPSILRAALQLFTMGFSDEHAGKVIQEHGEGDYINRLRDTATQVGMLSCFFLSFLHEQAINAPAYQDDFEAIYGSYFIFNLYLIATNLCGAFLVIATVTSIAIIVVMNFVRESTFNDWHDKCEYILRIPYLAMVYAFVAWGWSLAFLSRPLYGDQGKVGAYFQLAIILVTDLLIIVVMMHMIYSNQKVQTQGKKTE